MSKPLEVETKPNALIYDETFEMLFKEYNS